MRFNHFRPDPNGRAIYTVRYTFRPYFYVQSLDHDLRFGHKPGANGKLGTVRMPQQFSIVREYLFEGSQNKDDEARRGDPARQANEPVFGSL